MSKLTDLTEVTTLADGDLAMAVDVSNTTMDATGTNSKVTLANVYAYIKTKTDLLYATVLGADDNYVTDAEKTKLSNISITQAVDLDALESASHAAVTVSDSSEIDLTLTGQQISASIVAGSIDETKLDVSVNASLDLADSAVQPAGLSGYFQTANIDDTPVNGETSAPISSNWAFDHAALASSDTVVGHVEIGTTAETNTGTDATRAVSPDGLAGSYAGTKSISVQVTDGTSDVATGDGKAYITIPEALNGMNLVRAQATVVTAGTTNATTVMIHNKTDAQDMLSGAISIASGGTVGTVGTINGSFDDVATNDVLRIDVDSVSTTAPKGLMVILEFRLP